MRALAKTLTSGTDSILAGLLNVSTGLYEPLDSPQPLYRKFYEGSFDPTGDLNRFVAADATVTVRIEVLSTGPVASATSCVAFDRANPNVLP